jgi:nucleoside-diphosphate-sugar epimerase
MKRGTIIGLDILNSYYDPSLKEYRLREIEKNAKQSSINYQFVKGDLADRALIDRLFAEHKFDIVVN